MPKDWRPPCFSVSDIRSEQGHAGALSFFSTGLHALSPLGYEKGPDSSFYVTPSGFFQPA